MNIQNLFFALIIINFIVFINKPDHMFWVYVLMALDFGGYFSGYTESYFYDPYFVALFLPLVSPNFRFNKRILSSDFKKVIFFLGFFALFYHSLIYGMIIPWENMSNPMLYVYKHRLDILSFLTIIPAYIFSLRRPDLLFKVMIIVSFIPLIIFIFSLLTSVPLIPIAEFERYSGSGIMRKSMRSYLFAQFLFPFAILLLLDKAKLKYRNLILTGGLLIVIIQGLTLTRRILVFVAFQLVYTIFLHNNYFGSIKNNSNILKISVFILIIAISMGVFFPKYLTYISEGFSDVYSIVSTGESKSGEMDARMESDIPKHLSHFYENPFFGTGFDPIWYDTIEGLSANDTPITAALGMFGLIGVLLYSVFYIMTIKIIYKLYRLLKFDKRLYNLRTKYYYIYLMFFGFVILYMIKFTVYIPSLYLEIIMGKENVSLMLYFGIMLGLFKYIENLIVEKKI